MAEGLEAAECARKAAMGAARCGRTTRRGAPEHQGRIGPVAAWQLQGARRPHRARTPDPEFVARYDLDPEGLIQGRYKDMLANLVVITATDGNHGKALAAAAQTLGCICVIVLHANVSAEREQAIAAYGAQIIRIEGNYDESVEHAAHPQRKTAGTWFQTPLTMAMKPFLATSCRVMARSPPRSSSDPEVMQKNALSRTSFCKEASVDLLPA